jgi:hypothetical protein
MALRQMKANLLRLLAAVIAGASLGIGSGHLFCRLAPDACELMFVCVGRVCSRVGLRGAFAADDVTLLMFVLVFFVVSWCLLSRLGPVRNRVDASASGN